LGGIWAYYEFGTVQISGHPENTQEYIQGDKTLRTMRCKTCGCITHWEPLNAEPGARHGVNLRNFGSAVMDDVQIRRFDGADTWQFLD
jgi:hypothetical protein